jgi:acyl carrier protein
MTTQELLDQIALALGRDPGSVKLEDTPNTLDEWDSIGHLSIISTIDSELNVPVQDEELQAFSSIGELVERLKIRNALED